jgi:hypothetical protein
MTDGGGDFIFDALCTDSPSGSDDEEPVDGEADEGCPAIVAPPMVPTRWGATHGRSQRDRRM